MNKVIMMGRITHDLELKTTPSGQTVCSFRIAVDRNYQKQGEEKKTDYFNVVAWRSTAEFITRYFGKGRLILIEGEMQTRPYTDKNGNKSTWHEIVVDKVHFTGEKKAETESNAPTVYTNPHPAAIPASQPEYTQAEDADDEYPL